MPRAVSHPWSHPEKRVRETGKRGYLGIRRRNGARLVYTTRHTTKITTKHAKRPYDFREAEPNLFEVLNKPDISAIVYCDGSSSATHSGYGLFYDDERSVAIAGARGDTNNRMEGTAVREVLKRHPKGRVVIYTDSDITIKALTVWRAKWEREEFDHDIAGIPYERKNYYEAYKPCYELLDARGEGDDVHFVHINGHVGIYGNEVADKLAKGQLTTIDFRKGDFALARTFAHHVCAEYDDKAVDSLAQRVFHRHPWANVYASERAADRKPGTIIRDFRNGQVIFHLVTQRYPGASTRTDDTSDMRLFWFKKCLKALVHVPEERIDLPVGIGCVTDSEWPTYQTAIRDILSPRKQVVLWSL